MSCSSKAEARSREHEAPSDRTRRPVEEPVREDSVQCVYDPRPHRAAPGQGRGEKSKNPDQRHSWSNPTSEPAASEWIGKARTIREHKEEEINRALQREAMGLLAEQEKQYARALGEVFRKYHK